MVMVHGEIVCSCTVCICNGNLYFSSLYKWATSSFHEYIFSKYIFPNIMLPILKKTPVKADGFDLPHINKNLSVCCRFPVVY